MRTSIDASTELHLNLKCTVVWRKKPAQPCNSDVTYEDLLALLKMISCVFLAGQLSFSISACASAPDMILGVWISTKPLLVRVSLKSWHTPDCRRKMAWLVVVFKTQTHACKMAQLPHLDFFFFKDLLNNTKDLLKQRADSCPGT